MFVLRNNPLERFINLEFIDNAIVFLVVMIILLLCTIYFYLYKKKRDHLLQKSVQKSIELWMSKAILEEYDNEEDSSFYIPEKFIKHFQNPVKREFALAELLKSKKNLTGAAAENVIKLYLQLGFKTYSIKKFRSKRWYIKAKGIQELYLMDQVDMLTKIYKHTNSSNEYVRMEAQTAVIHFSGFEGLRFLEQLTYPMNEWQQLQLLEQLRPLDLVEMTRLPKWLRSSNDTVVLFALKLAEEFQQYQVHKEVAEILKNPGEIIRRQAIRTLHRIASEQTAFLLAGQYQWETFHNKIAILQHLRTIGSKDNVGFFMKALEDEDDTIKIGAAKALYECCEEGNEILEKKAMQQPLPYQRILLHVKADNN